MRRLSSLVIFLTLAYTVLAQSFTPFYAGELEPNIPPRRFFYQHTMEIYGIADYTLLLHAKDNATFSGGVGLQYAYFFHQCVGIGVGVQYMPYRNIYSSNGLTMRQTFTENVDPLYPNETFERVTRYDFREQSILHSVETPISIYFVTPDWHRVQFRSALSFVLGWNVAEQYNLNGTYTKSIYYPNAFVNIDDLSDGSLGSFPLGYNGDADSGRMTRLGRNCLLGNHYSLAAEIGMGIRLTSKTWLDLSAWATYGLTDTRKQQNDLDYENFQTIFTTNQIAAIHNAAVGIKLGLRFSLGRQRPAYELLWKKKRLFGFDQQVQTNISTRQSLPSGAEVFSDGTGQEEQSSLVTELHLTGTYVDDGTSLSIEIPTIAARVQHARIASDIIIMFELGQTEPTATSKLLLRMLADALHQNMPKQLLVRGHTCNLGKARTNLVLGQKRADRVKELLAEYGIPAEIIVTSSAGQSEPKVPNTSEANRALNRRITMTYIY